MNKLIIIGGGASGMMAAISAARHGAKVTLLEHMDRIGKKILSTGNGKCNYTNRRQGLTYYRGDHPSFAASVLHQFGFEETVSLFQELGIYPRERDGYFYPASGQAASVLDALRMELRRLSVEILTGCRIISVKRTNHCFLVQTEAGVLKASCCIFACGGMAFPKSGSDGSAFSFIQAFGHTFSEVVPALVQLKARQSFFKSIAGIRGDISVQLYIDGKQIAKDRGEVQLTDYGISGIPVFQISRYAAKALKDKKQVQAVLDFVPWLTKEQLFSELSRRFSAESEKTSEEALIGFFPKKLIPLFLKENKIPLQKPAKQIEKKSRKDLSDYLKHVTIDIIDTKGFDSAQVSAGGVHTAELNPESLESLLVPNLYFAGEVIDIDGMCGGYNLQWAWSSGYVAGMHAALCAPT